MAAFTIIPARSVITMNPAQPRAEAVAARDGHILAVGAVDELARWGEHAIDDRFRDAYVMAGHVEAHSHVFAGSLWAFPYVGYYPRTDPRGQRWEGCRSLDAVIERLADLSAAMEDPAEPLIAWGLDPIYFPGERLLARHLDRASSERPIFVYHVSGHLATVNGAALRRAGITAEEGIEGIMLEDGQPNGELREPRAMLAAGDYLARIGRAAMTDSAIRDFGAAARNAGCTTVADLGTTNLANPEVLERWRRVTGEADFPARVVMYANPAMTGEATSEATLRMVAGTRGMETPKLRFPGVKLILDGSIQGFSARVGPPGYLGTGETGIWLYEVEQLNAIVRACHEARINIHVHCNGDEAVDRFLDAVEEALLASPWLDHRHTVEHCQLTRPDQYRRMAALRVCANIFSNHLWYWGDQHHDITVGPGRAATMNAAGTALREGIRFALHSDAHVTPLGQLHTAWCAVNRVTPSGRVLGPEERISVEAALRAVTINAAYVLHLDHEIGSIEPGKRADFTVLAEDPFAVDPARLREVAVVGTVVGAGSEQIGLRT